MSEFEVLALAVLVGLLAVLTVIDLRHQILPNRLVLRGTIAAAVAAPLLPADGYLSGLIGAVVAFTVFAAIYYGRPGVIGGGDVKLAALIGFALGFPGALIALALAPVLMLVVAAPMLAARRWSLSQRVAYGPYMAVGTATIAVLMVV